MALGAASSFDIKGVMFTLHDSSEMTLHSEPLVITLDSWVPWPLDHTHTHTLTLQRLDWVCACVSVCAFGSFRVTGHVLPLVKDIQSSKVDGAHHLSHRVDADVTKTRTGK